MSGSLPLSSLQRSHDQSPSFVRLHHISDWTDLELNVDILQRRRFCIWAAAVLPEKTVRSLSSVAVV